MVTGIYTKSGKTQFWGTSSNPDWLGSAFHENCCECVPVCRCVPAVAEVTVVIDRIIDNVCSNCAVMNGTYVLPYNPRKYAPYNNPMVGYDECVWADDYTLQPCALVDNYRVFAIAMEGDPLEITGWFVEIRTDAGLWARWETELSEGFDCTTSRSLSFVTGSTWCDLSSSTCEISMS